MLRIFLAALLLSSPAIARAETSAFDSGLSDRTSYETWFGGLSGDYQTGALYWVGQRSKKPPGTCYDGPSADWTKGCLDAKQRLDPNDRRRLTEADYRKGWNSYVQSDVARSPASQPAYGPSSVDRQLTAAANADCSMAVVAPPFSGVSWDQATAKVTECENGRRRATSQMAE